MTMKRKCADCKALSYGLNSSCLLGYKIENILKNRYFGFYVPIPLEKCPKPKTNKEFSQLILNRNKSDMKVKELN